MIDDGNPATILFTPGESGVSDSPYARHKIVWGDGKEENSTLLPVGRPYSYSHQYTDPGTYTIRVILVNSGGENSDPTGGINPDSVFVLRQKPASERKKKPVKWSGMAMPDKTIGQALALVESEFPEATTTLAVRAQRDSTQIVVAAVPNPIESASVVITQDGKLVSSGRVLSADGNILFLDSGLSDAYDAHISTVTVSRPSLTGGSREFVRVSHRPSDWGFPQVTDGDLVRASLAMLFATRPMERVMRPEIGCRIIEQVFEPNDFIGAQITRRYVLDAALLEPRAVVESVAAEIREDEILIQAGIKLRPFEDEAFDFVLSLSPAGQQ